MVIEVKDIKILLSQLSEMVISREQAQKQAIEIRETYDKGILEFHPKEYEDKIWDTVQFIELFAEKTEENTYLYSENDLNIYIKENGWDVDE